MKIHITLINNKNPYSNKRCLCLDFRSFSLQKFRHGIRAPPFPSSLHVASRRVASRRRFATGTRAKRCVENPSVEFARFNPSVMRYASSRASYTFFLPVGNQSVQPPARGLSEDRNRIRNPDVERRDDTHMPPQSEGRFGVGVDWSYI